VFVVIIIERKGKISYFFSISVYSNVNSRYIHLYLFDRQVENDLQPLEQSKLELTGKTYHLERLINHLLVIPQLILFSKNEPELINLLTKASDIQSRLANKLAEHHKYLNVYKKIISLFKIISILLF